MKRYRGSDEVPPGVYFNIGRLSFESMKESGCLPGTEDDRYHQVPTVVLMIAAPLLGGLYVVFLPIIGFVMLAWVIGAKAVELAVHATLASVRVLRPAWTPARALLGRRKPKADAEKQKDRWAEDVEKQLAEEDTNRA